MSGPEQTLAALYHAFNRRDLDSVLTRMHAEVDWPNAWEGGRVHGRDAVRAYWGRQFEEVSSIVEPVGFETREGGESSLLTSTRSSTIPAPAICSATRRSGTSTASRAT